MLLVKSKWYFLKRQLQAVMKNIIKFIIRRWFTYVKFFGHRGYALLLPPLVLFLLAMWPTLWWSLSSNNWNLEPAATEPTPPYNMSRSLKHYLLNVPVLIEPTRTTCDNLDKVLVIAAVSTTSTQFQNREAVRESWGVYQPTYFIMGLSGDRSKQMIANRRESILFNDIIVFEFEDGPLNQTLKTALMMQWTRARCPQAQFLLKTEQDVMVNPWTLHKVLWENRHAELIGHSLNDKPEATYEFKKGYMQKVIREEGSLQYLSGTGYLIRGDYITTILNKAFQVPMIIPEDVYFTHLVAHKALGLTLTHDRRISPYKPWLPLSCIYWNQASIHSLAPTEMLNAWYHLEDLVVSYKNSENICKYFNKFYYLFSDLFLY